MRKKRVLVLGSEFPPFAWGGVGRYIFELARNRFPDCSFDVVSVPTYALQGEDVDHRVSIFRINQTNVINCVSPSYRKALAETTPTDFTRIRAVTQQITNEIISNIKPSYDVLYIQDFYTYFFAEQLIARGLAKHISVALHLPLSTRFSYFDKDASKDLQQVLEAALIRDADSIVVPSEFSRRNLSLIYNVVSKKCHVCRLGVEKFRGERSNEANVLQMVSVCRLTEQKGLQYYPKVISGLNSLGAKFELTIVGRGPYGDYLRNRVESVSSLGQVRFIGSIEKMEELQTLYAASDVYLSFAAQETFGLSIIESMSCGCVPLCFDVGSVSELFRPGVHGFLFRPNDWRGVVSTLHALTQDKGVLAKMAEATQTHSLQFNWQTHVKALTQDIWA